jgi:UTP:GlnB (protein PII) uridylyltransferase
MPDRYGQRYDAIAIADHARVAYRRGRASTAVGTFGWQRATSDGLPLVVVAEDRPGLLAKISAALVLARSTFRADAYTRRSVAERSRGSVLGSAAGAARSRPAPSRSRGFARYW